MNALTTTPTGSVSLQPSTITFGPEQIDLIKRTICKGATDDELKLFLGQCQRTGLDPFAKQIHAVKRWNSKDRREEMSIQVGIDGFRLIADRHRDDNGERDYAGQVGPFWCGEDGEWKDVWLSSAPPSASKVGVLRKGFTEPVYGVALFRSYVQTTREGSPTRFWAQMPDVMLAKVAEALALRKAFPNDLSGLYTSDEMGQADSGPRLDPSKAVPPVHPQADHQPVSIPTPAEVAGRLWDRAESLRISPATLRQLFPEGTENATEDQCRACAAEIKRVKEAAAVAANVAAGIDLDGENEDDRRQYDDVPVGDA